MLGRKGYTADELTAARAMVDRQLAGFRAMPDSTAFEAEFANGLVIQLDRYFVHRVRTLTGKDTNPLSEVELIVDSLMAGGVFAVGTVVKWQPASSVTGLAAGDVIALTADSAAALATAFLTEIERRSA